MVCCPRALLALSALGLSTGLLVAAGAPVATPARPAAKPGEFQVDPVHSSVIFRIQHMNTSFFYGRFDHCEGRIALDAEKPEGSSVELAIQAESVDTNSAKRDDHVRSPDFLNASEFPEIGFKSESVKALGQDRFEVSGQLSLHGETKPLTVEVQQTGLGKAPRGDGRLAGYETSFTIKRSDFGMDNMLDMLGDEVRVTLSVEAHGQ